MNILKNLFGTQTVKQETTLDIVGNDLLINGHPANFGTQDLVRIAGYASRHGFTIELISVTDMYLMLLSEEEIQEVSGEMIAMMNKWGSEEVEAALQDEFDGYYVSMIALKSNATGEIVYLDRKGYVGTDVGSDIQEEFLAALNEGKLELFG